MSTAALSPPGPETCGLSSTSTAVFQPDWTMTDMTEQPYYVRHYDEFHNEWLMEK